MDGLTLLRRAHKAGLAVAAEGDRLVIRGPRRAEPVAQLLIEHKSIVLAALAPLEGAAEPAKQSRADGAEAIFWRDRFSARLVHWFRDDRGWCESELLAYGELILEWRKSHSGHPDPRRCAGCGDELSDDAGLPLDSGVRVHFDEARRLTCLTTYGQKWRGEAVTGLQALGLDPPEGFTLP
jgi:hypothetical protein